MRQTPFRSLLWALLLLLSLVVPRLSVAQEEGGGFKVKKWKGPGDEQQKKESTAVKALIIGLGAGYGRMNWRHNVSNVYQSSGNTQLLFPGSPDSGSPGYLNLAQSTATQAGAISGNSSEKGTVKYTGTGSAIPFTLDLLYAVNDFRIGLTGSYELLSVNKLTFEDGALNMQDISLSGKTRVWKYGLQLEYMFFEVGDFQIGGQLKGGLFSLKGDYDKELVQKKLMLGGGIIAEYPVTDLVRVYVNPSYEHRQYTSGELIDEVKADNKIGTIYLHAGIRLRMENLFGVYPLCPIPSCHTRMVHVHNGHKYRGQRWWQKQKPKVGENLPKETKAGQVVKPYVVRDPEEAKERSAKLHEKRQKKSDKAKNQVLKEQDKANRLQQKNAGEGEGEEEGVEGEEGETIENAEGGEAPAQPEKAAKPAKVKKQKKEKKKKAAEEPAPDVDMGP